MHTSSYMIQKLAQSLSILELHNHNPVHEFQNMIISYVPSPPHRILPIDIIYYTICARLTMVWIAVTPTACSSNVLIHPQLTPWFASLGYSLCFGTMLVKMARVYYIFDQLKDLKKGVVRVNTLPTIK